MTAHPKSPVTRSPAYLAHIRTLPCLVSGREGVQACHFRLGTDGGTGMRPSDWFVTPLAPEEHMIQHTVGEESYWRQAISEGRYLMDGFIKDALRWRHHLWEQSNG